MASAEEAVLPECHYSDLLSTNADATPYRLLTTEAVGTFEANGRTFLRFRRALHPTRSPVQCQGQQ